jgi:hypothetical protein
MDALAAFLGNMARPPKQGPRQVASVFAAAALLATRPTTKVLSLHGEAICNHQVRAFLHACHARAELISLTRSRIGALIARQGSIQSQANQCALRAAQASCRPARSRPPVQHAQLECTPLTKGSRLTVQLAKQTNISRVPGRAPVYTVSLASTSHSQAKRAAS